MTSINRAERIAKRFHEVYEELAPHHGYETRRESAVPWDQVPEQNRGLMIDVVDALLNEDVIEEGEAVGRRISAALMATAEMSYNGRLVPINSTGMREVIDEAQRLRAALLTLLAFEDEYPLEGVDPDVYEDWQKAVSNARLEATGRNTRTQVAPKAEGTSAAPFWPERTVG